MKNIVVYIVLPLFFGVFYNAEKNDKDIKDLSIGNGIWVSSEDKLEVMVVKNQYIYYYYDYKVIDTTRYKLVNTSCDTTYKSDNNSNLLFLAMEDGYCYEVEMMTKKQLLLIFTGNSRYITYNKSAKFPVRRK